MVWMLRFHAGYRCRDSGVCCSSGWAIPVEVSVHRTLEAALASGRLAAPRVSPAGPFITADLPSEYAALLAVDASGACLFHDAAHGRCAIHSALGAGAKPASCRAFPRIVVQDPRGTALSLSHYCPSALDLLFGVEPIDAVELTEADVADDSVEGLDARHALPPALNKATLVDWESLTGWEQFTRSVFEHAASPETALDELWRGYEALQAWRASDGPLASVVEGLVRNVEVRPIDAGPIGIGAVCARAVEAQTAGARAVDARVVEAGAIEARAGERPFTDEALVDAVWSAIPAHVRPAALAHMASDRAALDKLRRFVDSEWRAAGRPLCRYLAARAHACWPLHQGRGLRTALVYLEAVLAVTRAHALDWSQRTSAPLDRTGLRESIRRADLWLIHLAAPEILAHTLDRLPTTPPDR